MPAPRVSTASPQLAEEIYRRRADGETWDEIKRGVGVPMVTAKRILERFGLQHSPNGKNPRRTEKWTRPCIKCKSTEERTKWLYLCKTCRKLNREHMDGPDSFYEKGA